MSGAGLQNKQLPRQLAQQTEHGRWEMQNVFFIIQTLTNDHVDSSVLEQQLEKGLLPSTDKRKNAQKNDTIAVLERDLEAGKKDEREFCLAVGSLMVK